MSPLELDILLHYHARTNEYADGDPYVMTAPAVRDAINRFVGEDGLLKYRDRQQSGRSGTYELTERGRVYVEHVLALPLPVQTWKMPLPNTKEPQP